MGKMLLIFFSMLVTSCSAIAETERDRFYEENAIHLNVVLKEGEKKLAQPQQGQGVEVLFPLFLKTRITNDIQSFIHNPAGLLIKTGDSKISFIRESSEELFFVGENGSLLAVYSDLFTKNLKEIREKYANNPDSLHGMLDFKMALSILDYEKRGYFKKGDFYIFYLIGNKSSEAFVLNKKMPEKAMRIGALGLGINEFESLLLNIERF